MEIALSANQYMYQLTIRESKLFETNGFDRELLNDFEPFNNL